MDEISPKNHFANIAYNQGKQLAKDLTSTLNTITYEKEIIEGFVDGVIGQHRTLQQSTMRAIYKLLISWAEMEENGRFDARNVATVRFCKNIKDMIEDESIHFPFI